MQIYTAHKKQTVTGRRCLQQNKCIFSNRRNSRKVCSSESRRRRGRLFHRCGPATVNERSPRLVRVLGTLHVATLDEPSRRRPAVEVSWQSSAKYCGDRPFIALYTNKYLLTYLKVRALQTRLWRYRTHYHAAFSAGKNSVTLFLHGFCLVAQMSTRTRTTFPLTE